MRTKPIKKLLQKYEGNLLLASKAELVKAFKRADDQLELIIEKAKVEYEYEKK